MLYLLDSGGLSELISEQEIKKIYTHKFSFAHFTISYHQIQVRERCKKKVFFIEPAVHLGGV